MNKKQIRLTESDFKQIVKESVNKILNEAYGTPDSKTKERINSPSTKEDFDKVADDLYYFVSKKEQTIPIRYSDIMFKYTDEYVTKMKNLLTKLQNYAVQQWGEQPDFEYFEKHPTTHQKQMEKDRYSSIKNTDWHSAYGDRG